MRGYSMGLLVLCVLTAMQSCSKKYPRVNYLSPLNREDSGFVDTDTWQQVSFGNFFPESERAYVQTLYIPYPLGENEDYEEIKKINARGYKKINREFYSLKELLKADFDNVPLEKLPIDQVDPELRKIAGLKKHIFDKSCLHARVLSLYSWLINSTKNDYEPVTAETLTAMNARFFPPPTIYFADAENALLVLENLVHKRGYKYEIISERQANEGYFRCKMIIHYKMKDLVLKDEGLRQMTQVHD